MTNLNCQGLRLMIYSHRSGITPGFTCLPQLSSSWLFPSTFSLVCISTLNHVSTWAVGWTVNYAWLHHLK